MRRLVWIAVALVAVGACDVSASEPDDGFRVVATTTILGDIVSNIVGPDVIVDVLMPVGVDPHDYRASSTQVAAIARADLVIANGGGLEEGLADVLDAAREDGVRVVEVLPVVDPIQRQGTPDPHFWLDPLRVGVAAQFMADELGVSGSDRVRAYLDRLETLHRDTQALLGGIQSGMRKLVTNHDSFAYFAERYGFEVIGVVIPGGSTLGDPSSQALADLVKDIDSYDVPAIFADSAKPTLLAETIAQEAGRSVDVVELFTGSVGGAGSGADTVTRMLLLNANRIAEALIP